MSATATAIDVDRDSTIKRIRKALNRRSSKSWSVTGGRGTAWGWIHIDAPPSRRTMHCRLKPGATTKRPEDYEMVNTGERDGESTPEDRAELAKLLGLERVHAQGESIPAGNDYYREYIDRAEGRKPSVKGTPYWD